MPVIIRTYVKCAKCGIEVLGHEIEHPGTPKVLRARQHAEYLGWIAETKHIYQKDILCPHCKDV